MPTAFADGRFVAEEQQPLDTNAAGTQASPVFARLASGGMVATWVDNGTVVGQRFDALGGKIGSEFIVSASVATSYVNAVGLAGGGFVVGWTGTDVSGTGIKAQLFNSGGAPIGGVIALNQDPANYQYGPVLTALATGGFAAAWQEYDSMRVNVGIEARVFNAAGVGVTGDITVAGYAGNTGPAIVALADGNFAVAYSGAASLSGTSPSNINARIYDVAGNPTGNFFTTNGTTSYLKSSGPRLTVLASGDIVLAWAGHQNFSGPLELFTQMFSSTGAQKGSVVSISTSVSGYAVTATDTGFAVAFGKAVNPDPFNTNVTESDIAVQLFDMAGLRDGSTFIVNQVTRGDQASPSIAQFGSGDLAIAFTDRSSDANGDVIYRLLVSPPTEPIVHDPNNDFNGDGRSDILWRNDNGALTQWLGQPNGGFIDNHANAGNQVPTDWQVVGTGDYNGDGRDDVLWRNETGALTQWLGQANGGFVDNHANAGNQVPTDWHVVGTADFNGDGRDDILWRNDRGSLTQWLGQANGGFVDNHANAGNHVPIDWHVAGTGDFNGDGRGDILWRNETGALTQWLGQANGGFIDNHANAGNQVPIDWHVAGIGDFNGDGRDDILWRNETGALTQWLGRQNGGFLDNHGNAANQMPTDWHVAAIGDYNGDGRDDILWRNDTGALTQWLGQASGGFLGNQDNAGNQVPTDWHIQHFDYF